MTRPSIFCATALRQLMQSLADASNLRGSRTAELFGEFGESSVGNETPHFSSAASQSLAQLAHTVDCQRLADQPALVLLAAQTHYAIYARLLAWAAISPVAAGSVPAGSQQRQAFFAKLESGQLFRQHGWVNLIESPQLSWYLQVWNRSLAAALAQMATEVHATCSDQDNSHTLHDTYRTLVPRAVRHQLGEYYTPPWLAQYVLDSADYHGQPCQRVLDPCCGSGVFLAAAIGRVGQQVQREGLTPQQVLEGIIANVVGIDLNPLAVLAAQANYLLALNHCLPSGTLSKIENEVHLPVYQADAILGEDLPPLEPFHHIVGNPPWVGWETLTDDYRQQTQTLWKQYGLFPHTGMDAILGRGKKDLSMLMSYAVSDRWLQARGKLSFIITQSVFKSVGAAQGFRRFRLGEQGEPLQVDQVEDLAALPVFDGATTRTAIVTWTKGQPTRYPLPYRLWQRTAKRNVGEEATQDHVRSCTRQLSLVAQPVDPSDPTSSWLTARPTTLSATTRLLGPSSYTAREGVNTGGANGVFWVREIRQTSPTTTLVENLHTAGRKKVSKVQAEVETALLYPLLRGREVRRWTATTQASVLLVQDVQTRRGIDAEVMQSRYPLALDFLSRFETTLRSRAALKRYFSRGKGKNTVETGPFYSMFNVGPYTLAPYKVVWHRMVTPVEAVVVEPIAGRVVLPQETHAFIPCDQPDEAYYLAALLNSTPLELAARSYSQVGGKSFASPHLLKHLHLPSFDRNDATHTTLAQKACDLQQTLGKMKSSKREKAIDHLDSQAATIWGIDGDQLVEVRSALAELTYRP